MLFKMGHYFAGWGFKIIFETTPLRNENRWFYNPVTSRLTKDIPGYLFNMNLPFMESDKVFVGTKNTTLTPPWQPLGPLLKVELLVGYI